MKSKLYTCVLTMRDNTKVVHTDSGTSIEQVRRKLQLDGRVKSVGKIKVKSE